MPYGDKDEALSLTAVDLDSNRGWWYVARSPEGQGYTFQHTTSNRYMGAYKAAEQNGGLFTSYTPQHIRNSNDRSAANIFTIEAGTGLRAGQFRLKSNETEAVIAAEAVDLAFTGMSGSVVQLSSPDKEAENQYFGFVLEDLEFSSIEYKLPQGRLISNQPKYLTSQTATNHTSEEQKRSITLSETVEESRHWDNELGIMAGVEMGGKAGIPFVAEGEIKVKVEGHYNRSWGTAASSSKTWSDTVELNIGAKKTYKVTASIVQANLEVPYVATWVSKESKIPVTIHGVFKGVTTYDFSTTYFEIPYVGPQ